MVGGLMREIVTPRQIGAAIREERQHKGLTQQQLADQAAVSRGFVNRLEKGSAAAVYPEKLFAVLGVLGLRMILETPEGECASEAGNGAAPSTGERTLLASQAASGLVDIAAQSLLQRNASVAEQMAKLARNANALAREQLDDSLRQVVEICANSLLSASSPLFAPRDKGDEACSEQED